jgi:hypothetical protein
MLEAFNTAGSSPPQDPDLLVSGGGTVYLVFPVSPAGESWIESHIPDEAHWFAGGVAVEHRYIEAIVVGATADGLRVLR